MSPKFSDRGRLKSFKYPEFVDKQFYIKLVILTALPFPPESFRKFLANAYKQFMAVLNKATKEAA